jgi:thiol-disulfide isomerase/thioredoxin
MLPKYLQPGAVLLISLALSFSAYPQSRDAATQQESNLQTQSSLPQSVLDMELESPGPERFRLSNYQGNIVVLGFWATWCGPCRFQTPVLVKLQKEFRASGVRMIELSTESPSDSAQDIRHWMLVHKVNYRVGWAPPDLVSSIMQAQHSLPQMFVISRDGRILKRFIGFSKDKTEPILRKVIEEAIKEAR